MHLLKNNILKYIFYFMVFVTKIRDSYRRILMNSHLKKREVYQEFLSKVKILEDLDDWERLTIADALEQASFQAGEDVVRQGETGTNFFMIIQGQAEVTQRAGPQTEAIQVGVLGPRYYTLFSSYKINN